MIYLKQTDSTNKQLQKLIVQEKLHEGTCLYTDYQTSGQGQIGNTWESEESKNLLFSILLKPININVKEQFIISQAVSLAILDYLLTQDTHFSIKWPNDIYHKDKKICGILIENNLERSYIKECIIGIGININQELFLSDAPNPISLFNITNKIYNTKQVLNNIYSLIMKRYMQIYSAPNNIKKQYLENLYRFNIEAKYKDENEEYTGKIIGVENTGHLNIITEKGEAKRYAFKEVSYLK